ncbi:MAG: hypothetical protein LAKADJCE_00792 [Candidatus Argoarchaeum ethanivorans]|uniref:Uncharacterized protein n=1 Tax=Candidatus Argoarchaeum ethanivorans TaxID=2608793 RepID=A0A811TDK8_9EURY|nr:MAG: hypothetical protein LAKADJCE_00792 [Candidatus Argoarchaeum ethanivorans]
METVVYGIHHQKTNEFNQLDELAVARMNKSIDILKGNPFYGKDIKKLRGELDGRCRPVSVIVGGKKVCYEGCACVGYMLGCVIVGMVQG